MAHDPKKSDADDRGPESDHFGYGQQPLHRVDETTGDEGIEPPMGDGHDEATTGRTSKVPDRDDPADVDPEQIPGYPTGARGPDSQE